MDNPSTLLVVQDLLISKKFYVDVLGLILVEEYEDSLKLKSGSHNVFMFGGAMEAITLNTGMIQIHHWCLLLVIWIIKLKS